MVKISTYTKYGHRIIRIDERVGITSDITELRAAIQTAVDDGFLHVAVSFQEDSFLSSRILALLIEHAEKLSSRGGSFTVIAPTLQIIEVLSIFDLEWTLRTVRSEKELLAMPVRLAV